jgi:hypothetical protein
LGNAVGVKVAVRVSCIAVVNGVAIAFTIGVAFVTTMVSCGEFIDDVGAEQLLNNRINKNK